MQGKVAILLIATRYENRVKLWLSGLPVVRLSTLFFTKPFAPRGKPWVPNVVLSWKKSSNESSSAVLSCLSMVPFILHFSPKQNCSWIRSVKLIMVALAIYFSFKVRSKWCLCQWSTKNVCDSWYQLWFLFLQLPRWILAIVHHRLQLCLEGRAMKGKWCRIMPGK